jgi:hypothetical protein
VNVWKQKTGGTASAASNSVIQASPNVREGALNCIPNASPSARATITSVPKPSRTQNRDRFLLPSAEHVSTPNSRNMSTVPTSHETAVAIGLRR